MSKKIVTVCWSTTVEVELPDDVGINELNEFTGPNAERANKIIKDGYHNIHMKDGVITDVEDEDFSGISPN